MDVLQAIEHAEADLANTLDELRMARELVAALEQDAKKINIEIVGLKSYAGRQGLRPEPAVNDDDVVVPISAELAFGTDDGHNLAQMSRTDAVHAAMESYGGPCDRNTIHERLVDGGRYDSIDDVSLTLSGLKRSGRIVKLGQGLWQVAEPATAQAH